MELITNRGRVDLYDNFSWSLNYKTADVINLTGRKTAFTKTIIVPYSSNNALIFEGLNQANSDNVGFDTRKSLPCFLSHSGRILLEGNLVVNSWSKLKENERIELQIVQRTKELVSSIKGVSLNELDFSHLDHDYTIENILLSYDGFNVVNGLVQARDGYIYPLVDYGKDDTIPNEWNVSDMRPSLYLREIIDAIFLRAGKTFSSDFFDSPYFSSLVLLNTRQKILLTAEQLEPFETNVLNSTLQNTVSGAFDYPDGQVEIFTDIEIDTIVSDVSLQWDITTPSDPSLTVSETGTYLIQFGTQLTIEYAYALIWILNNAITTANPVYINQGQVSQYFIVRKNGVPFDNLEFINTPLQTEFEQTLGNPVEWYSQNTDSIIWEFEINLNAGDVLDFQILQDEALDSGLDNRLNVRFLLENTRITTKLKEATIQVGQEINFLNFMPEIKAEAFINTIFNTFNLWVIDDAYIPDNLIIEPRTNFFDLGGFVDWSEKLDISREIKNDYLADILPIRFKYRFDKSDDLNSKNYFEANQFGYCDFDSEVEIDFTTDEQEIKTALTPLIATETNGLIYPKIYAQDDEFSEKTDIGKVLKIGFVNEREGEYLLTDEVSQTVQNRYIVISEFDDVDSPTYSLTFDDAPTTLLQTSPSYWNLFRLFHQLTEEEKTRKGAKIVELWIYLDENDISQLDIRRVVFVNHVFYRIVSIDAFNPLTNTPTKVKLLQIESVKYDFTSNEIIYKMNQGFINLLSTNKNEPIQTNKNKYVQIR